MTKRLIAIGCLLAAVALPAVAPAQAATLLKWSDDTAETFLINNDSIWACRYAVGDYGYIESIRFYSAIPRTVHYGVWYWETPQRPYYVREDYGASAGWNTVPVNRSYTSQKYALIGVAFTGGSGNNLGVDRTPPHYPDEMYYAGYSPSPIFHKYPSTTADLMVHVWVGYTGVAGTSLGRIKVLYR